MAYQAYHQKRISLGLCKDCGETRSDSGTSIYCRKCSNKVQATANARKERKRKEWAASGNLVCNGCGAMLPDTTYKLCKDCREYGRMYRQKTKVARQNKKAASGECRACSAQAMSPSNYCQSHFLDNALRRYGIRREQYSAFWEKLEQQNFRCYYSGKSLIPGFNASIDHKIPRSKNGRNDIANMVWCDRNINAFKNDSTDVEFIQTCKIIASRFV